MSNNLFLLGLISAFLFTLGLSLNSPAAQAQQTGETVLLPDPTDTTGEYGLKVDIDQHWAAVASHDYFYIYHHNNGQWETYETQLLPYLYDPPNSLAEIAIDGHLMALGLEFFDTQEQEDVGAVALYTFTGKTWRLTHMITPPDLLAGSRFGDYVDLDASTGVLAVTCENCRTGAAGNIGQRTVFVYRLAGQQWLQEQRIVSSALSDYSFGHSLSIDGNTLAVGFPEDVSNAPNYRGTTIIYRAHTNSRSVGPIWRPVQTLTAPVGWKADAGENPDEVDKFGSDVSLDGQRLAVGAPHDQSMIGSFGPAGAIYTFTQASYRHWEPDQALFPPDFTPGTVTDFGASVDLAETELAIAAPYADGGKGSAYKVTLNTNTSHNVVKYAPSAGGNTALYGYGPGGAAMSNGRIILISDEERAVIIDTN